MSGFIPERILDEIRFRNDIVDVIGACIPLKRTGSTYKACCPFHHEKTPSFNVNPNMQIFKCFGCGEGGDVISFIMKHQGLDFVSAAKTLAERAGIPIEVQADSGEGAQRKVLFEIHRGIAQFYRRCLDRYPAAAKARDYVKARGLDDVTAAAFQIGYAPAGWGNALKWGEKYGYTADQLEQAGLVLRSSKPGRRGVFYDRFRDRLMFPVCDSQGRVIGFSARILVDDPKQPKYVNSPETPLFTKGRVLYGLDKARHHIVNAAGREAVICEGQIDVVRCHQFGISTAVAAQGTAFTEEHVQLLKTYADSVVLVYDADGAGQAAAVKTAHLFMKVGLIVRVAVLPPGEDPDSFLRSRGAAAFRSALVAAGSVTAFQIAVMGVKEADVRGIAATARICKAVLETVSLCSNAVQRERLLQEAAALLGLPQHALEADLAVMDAERKKQAERHAGRDAGGAGRVRDPAMAPAADVTPPDDVDSGEPDAAYEDEDPPPEVLAMIPEQRGAAAPVVKDRKPDIPAEERMLCEHLLQGAAGDTALVGLVEEYLPFSFITQPLCRTLMAAVIDAIAVGSTVEEQLVERDGPEGALTAFAASLRVQPERVKGRDYTPRDAVKDLILGFWRRYLHTARKRLIPAITTSKGCPEDAARRRQLTMNLKALQGWTTGLSVILTERERMDSA